MINIELLVTNSSMQIILSFIGFFMGSSFTYYLYKLQKNYDKKEALYDKIHKELYYLNKGFEEGKINELKEIELLKEKRSFGILNKKMKEDIKKLLKNHSIFKQKFWKFSENITKATSYKYIFSRLYDEVEKEDIYLYNSMPSPIVFAFLEDNEYKRKKTYNDSVWHYLEEINKMELENDAFNRERKEQGETTGSLKYQIKKFCKIFDDKELLKKSENLKSEYSELKKLNKKIIEKTGK
ncbi:MAG: hypothetical protein KAI55_03495 [Candidatus Aenigmarchaeota archaeon]|nr:hypothetical protein [Candidatus Aenigmarchaeota archaeon]